MMFLAPFFLIGSRGPLDGVAGAAGALVSTYQAAASDTADLTTYTFSAQAIGTASATRYVLVAVVGRGSAARTVSTVTIGGVSAVKREEVQNGNNTISWWNANVPTGTTGDVVVTWSGANLRCGIGIWSIENIQSATPTAVANDQVLSGSDLSVAIDVPAGGGAFGCVWDAFAGSLTYTWAGITERYDASIESLSHSGANLDFAAAQTGLTITATESGVAGTTNPILSAIAFGVAPPSTAGQPIGLLLLLTKAS